MIVYKITNKINDKVYIGQDTKNRLSYFGSGILLKKAIKKYGRENFEKKILQTCSSLEELNKAEIFHQNSNPDCFCPIGYNIMHGAFGGDNFTNNPNKEEYREKLRSKADHKHFPSWVGRKHSKETKLKMKLAKAGKYIGENNPNWRGGKTQRKQCICGKSIRPESKTCSSCFPQIDT